jgi:hypothetical protein
MQREGPMAPAQPNLGRGSRVGAIASAYELMQHEGPTAPAQPNLGRGSNSEWGVTRLVALAPYHLGENVRGERTQGVIRVGHLQ